ncbi:MAG: cytochrome o ubiquinol oxidase subunit IV [Candidatus Thiodiazotropha sp.]
MNQPDSDISSSVRSYLAGYLLALTLTAIPFSLLLFTPTTGGTIQIIIASAAVIQILVHFRFFLHLRLSSENSWILVSVLFSVLILFIMVGGTVWIMQDLNRHMMPMP